jgi:elongation factor Ts
MDQVYAKDSTKTIRQLIEENVAKTKENITVARFVRYQVGETAPAAPAE